MSDQADNHALYRQILDFKPRKSDLRKVAILEAVIDCIAAEGIDNATSQSVGRKAKMRRSHVAYYFPNRDEMLEAAVKFVVSTGQEIAVAHVVSAGTAEEKLVSFIEATFNWFERFPKHASVMLLLHYYGSCQDKYKKLHTQIREAGESRIYAILKSRKAKRGKGDASAKHLSQTIRYILVGSLADFFSTARTEDYQAFKAAMIESILALADDYWA